MLPHDVPHTHVHLELPRADYEALKRLNPGYGAVAQCLRKLVRDYLAQHEAQAANQPEALRAAKRAA